MMNALKSLFFTILFFPLLVPAQEEIHYSFWHDEYTLPPHLSVYVNNLVGQFDYLKHWDKEKGKYVSYMPYGLTYAPAADQTLEVQLATTYYHLTDYLPKKEEDFSPAYMDSIFYLGKKIATASLQYDSLGRLIHVQRTKKEHRRVTEKDEVIIQYKEKPVGSQLLIEINSHSFNWIANYSSIYAGNIKGRPLRLKSNWKILYDLNEEGILEAATSESEGYANRRVNQAPSDYTYDFEWDEKGRLLQKNILLKGDSLPHTTRHTYVERPFDYEVEAKRFPLLQVYTVKSWLNQNYEEEDLRMVVADSKTYLMYKTTTPVLQLDTSEYFQQYIYYTFENPLGIYRIKAAITRMPDLQDTLPYDPLFHKKRLRLPMEEGRYVRPPGMIDANHLEYFRKTIKPLNGGWKMITYQRGSKASTRFAIGYPPSFALYVPLDQYLIVDELNRVRYYYTYKRLFRVEWPQE